MHGLRRAFVVVNCRLTMFLGYSAWSLPVTKLNSETDAGYWKHMKDLEDLMNSKVYAFVNEDVPAEYIQFPNATVQFYDVLQVLCRSVIQGISNLRKKVCTFSLISLEKLKCRRIASYYLRGNVVFGTNQYFQLGSTRCPWWKRHKSFNNFDSDEPGLNGFKFTSFTLQVWRG